MPCALYCVALQTWLRASANSRADRETRKYTDLQAKARAKAGYTIGEYEEAVGKAMSAVCHLDRVAWCTRQTFQELMVRAMFIVTHAILARGAEVRALLYSRVYIEERHVDDFNGVPLLPIFTIVSNAGKCNKDGHVVKTNIVSHHDWKLCPLGALFSLLYYEWDLLPGFNGEAPGMGMDFSTREGWYDFAVFHPYGQPDVELQYRGAAGHLEAVKAFLERASIECVKKTHSCRGSAARYLDLQAVAVDQIARLGNWLVAKGHLESAYLDDPPMQAVYAAAGFPSTLKHGEYYIPRLAATIPEELAALAKATFFVGADEALAAVKQVSAEHSLKQQLVASLLVPICA